MGGVAANIAVQLARLGARVRMAGAVGKDGDGARILEFLEDEGIDTYFILRTADYASAGYTAFLDLSGELIAGLADMHIYEALDARHCNLLADELRDVPFWLVDANLPAEPVVAMARADGNSQRMFAAVSVAKAPRIAPVLDRAYAVFANRAEAEVRSGRAIADPGDALEAGLALETLGAARVFITLGDVGAAVVADGFTGFEAPPPTNVRDVNGAGDAFAAGAIDALTAGANAATALRQGLALASLDCEIEGPTAPVTREKLNARMAMVP